MIIPTGPWELSFDHSACASCQLIYDENCRNDATYLGEAKMKEVKMESRKLANLAHLVKKAK
jgi:hypothetical protein